MKKLIALMFVASNLVLWPASAVLAEPGMPNLVGKWEARNYAHHDEGRGFFTNTDADGVWTIEKQDGRFFHGVRTYTMKHASDKKVKEGFSGVVSRDGKRVYIVDHDQDLLFGEILGDGSIEFVMMNDGGKDQHSKIGVLDIVRVK